MTAAAAEASPSLGAGVPLGLHVRVVRAPDSYRDDPDRWARILRRRVRAAIADLRRHGAAPAALLFDTVFSSDGLYTHPPRLHSARRAGNP